MTSLGQLALMPNYFVHSQRFERGGPYYFPLLRWSGSDKVREEDSFIIKGDDSAFGDHFVCHCKYVDSDPNTSYEATLNTTRFCFHLDTGIRDTRSTEVGSYFECNVGESLAITFEAPVLLDYALNHYKWGFYVHITACQKTTFPNQWLVNQFILVIDWTGQKYMGQRIHGHCDYPEMEYIPVEPYWLDPTKDARFWDVCRKVYPKVVENVKQYWRSWAAAGEKMIIKPNEGFQPHTRPKLDGRYFMFGEQTFNSYLPQVRNVGPYMIMKEAAYKSAIDSMPKLNDNSISNAIEIMSFIWGVIHDHKVTIPDSLKDLVSDSWLGYRYSYSTTVLDGEEALKYISRKMASKLRKSSDDRWLPTYGSSTYTVDGVPIQFRCRIHFRDETLSSYANAWDRLYELGLQPNLYVAWDMVPYSFVVDWALPIGDILSAMDAADHINSIKSRLSPPLYSLSYIRETPEGFKVKCYTRFVGAAPSYFVGGVFATSGPSAKTKAKRLADAVTLFS